MPTFQNNQTYTVSEKGVRLDPGEAVQTTTILSNSDLTRTANTPYADIIPDETIVSTDTEVTVPIDPEEVERLHFLRPVGSVKIYFNSKDNNGFTMEPGDLEVTFEVNFKIESVIVEALEAGSGVVIREIGY